MNRVFPARHVPRCPASTRIAAGLPVSVTFCPRNAIPRRSISGCWSITLRRALIVNPNSDMFTCLTRGHFLVFRCEPSRNCERSGAEVAPSCVPRYFR